MNTPLVNIVIPTCGRRQLLTRAVESALSCQGGDAEVIVIPNGSDQSWKGATEPWSTDKRVRISPITVAHANSARNHGLELATGKYVRFLDDDDYLLPAAHEQVELLESTGADLCSGRVENVDEDGTNHGPLSAPEAVDFVCAALAFSGFGLPTGHLFRRRSLKDCRWDVALDRRQDVGWLLDLAAIREWNNVWLDKPVGAWFQHRAVRVSDIRFALEFQAPIVERILQLHATLERTGRLDAEREDAIGNALWHHAHLGFPYNPLYWARVARQAQKLSSNARPPDPVYRSGLLGALDPLIVEWLLYPIRRITKPVKLFVAKARKDDFRRSL